MAASGFAKEAIFFIGARFNGRQHALQDEPEGFGSHLSHAVEEVGEK